MTRIQETKREEVRGKTGEKCIIRSFINFTVELSIDNTDPLKVRLVVGQT